MIPEHSAARAITLAAQGWNLSKIARHLGHDRKTVRIYLAGRRTPGQRRPEADSFAPFAAYATRRLRDDPHLRASGLHRELAGLGYTGSYSALTRELRSSAIATTCMACQQEPQVTVSRSPIRFQPQPLPIRVAPIAGQTVASYLHGLATVNHLSVELVLAHLPPWFTARCVTHDDLAGTDRADTADAEQLARLSGLSTAALLHALPAFGPSSHHGRPPMRATHACRRCAARHQQTEPVPVHLPAHQRLCTRHRIWLGHVDQIDLAATPVIIHAHRRAESLARRYTAPRLMLAELTARQQIIATRRDDEYPDLVDQRITALTKSDPRLVFDHPDLIEAATYPEAIRNAAQALTRPR